MLQYRYSVNTYLSAFRRYRPNIKGKQFKFEKILKYSIEPLSSKTFFLFIFLLFAEKSCSDPISTSYVFFFLLRSFFLGQHLLRIIFLRGVVRLKFRIFFSHVLFPYIKYIFNSGILMVSLTPRHEKEDFLYIFIAHARSFYLLTKQKMYLKKAWD